MIDLSGRTAVVTGASSGIGAATARALVDAGARVVGGARRVGRIETGIPFALDVSDRASCERFVQQAMDELGAIDILVNNAALDRGNHPFDASNEDDESLILGTNLQGLMRMTRLCLPHLREPAHIVNIGSVSGRGAYPGAAAYIATKYGVRGFTYALREDLLGRPIRVTTVDPGLTESEFAAAKLGGDQTRATSQYAPIEKLQASDVADCVLFAVTRPAHVNIDELVVKPIDHCGTSRVFRRA